jgi:hypothetical protein
MSTIDATSLSPFTQEIQLLNQQQMEVQRLELELAKLFESSPSAGDADYLQSIQATHQKMTEATKKAVCLAETLAANDQAPGKDYIAYRLQTKKYVSADAKVAAQLMHIKQLEAEITALFKRSISDTGSILSTDPLVDIEALHGRFSDVIQNFQDPKAANYDAQRDLELSTLNYAILQQIDEIKRPSFCSTPSPRVDRNNMQGALDQLSSLQDLEALSTFFHRMIDTQFRRIDIAKDGNCALRAIVLFLQKLKITLYGQGDTPEAE